MVSDSFIVAVFVSAVLCALMAAVIVERCIFYKLRFSSVNKFIVVFV